MANVKQVAFLVGMDKTPNGTSYRVIVANIAEVGPQQYEWKFVKKMLNEQSIIGSMQKGLQWANVKVVQGKLKGSAGELSRFNKSNVCRPLVILSRITDGNERTLGYRVADYNGNVMRKSLNDMLNFGYKVNASGGIPVQNAKFIGVSENNKKPFYAAFPGCNFIEEVMVRAKKPVNNEIKRVNTQANEKTLNKLTDLYNEAQIKELKLGKKNGLNIKIYANPQLSAEQMRILRRGLSNGVNVRPVAFPEFKEDVMAYYVEDLINGVNIKPYVNSRYSLEQLSVVSTAYSLGLDIGKLGNPSLSADEMEAEKRRLTNLLWNSDQVTKHESWKDV